MGFFSIFKAKAQAEPARSTKARGDAAENSAVAWLQAQGLVLLDRNYRTPGRGGGEIDAIMRARDGTLVFVEVRLRSSTRQGGAAASVAPRKRRRMVFAAGHYLRRFRVMPPCRFDVMACDGPGSDGSYLWQWLPHAFDAHE